MITNLQIFGMRPRKFGRAKT